MELVVLLIVFVLGSVVALGAAYVVYSDAKGRGNDSAGLWAAVTAIGFFVGLVPGVAVVVIYLLLRD